jgi:predicted transcriptional regulator
LKPANASPGRKARIGVESMNEFFGRAKSNARQLDRGAAPAPGLRISFEDPADFLEIITPARVRLLQQISEKPVALHTLAGVLMRDPSAVRRDIAVLEDKRLVKTSKVANPGHGMRTLVERAVASIELATMV